MELHTHKLWKFSKKISAPVQNTSDVIMWRRAAFDVVFDVIIMFVEWGSEIQLNHLKSLLSLVIRPVCVVFAKFQDFFQKSLLRLATKLLNRSQCVKFIGCMKCIGQSWSDYLS